MATNILMPALSPTMTEGNLARWLKQEGDRIKAGDVIAEIETDKATMEVEAVDEGILGRILVPAGTQAVKVNDVIAVLVEAGEAVPAAGAAPKAAPAAVAAPAAPAPVAAAPVATAPAPASTSGDRVFASPLARRMAAQAGLDIGKISGSGPNGRIVKADVDAALSRGPAPVAAAAPIAAPAPVATPRPAAPVAITAPHTAIPNSSIRKVIARRLAESKATIPHFYVSTDVETQLME